jgi:hypothetical protein
MKNFNDTIWNRTSGLQIFKFHLSELIGTPSQPDMQKKQIIGFLFKKIGYLRSWTASVV